MFIKKVIIAILFLILMLWSNEGVKSHVSRNLSLPLLNGGDLDYTFFVQHHLKSDKGLLFFQIVESFSLSKSHIKVRFPLTQKCVMGLRQTITYDCKSQDSIYSIPKQNGRIVYSFYYKKVSSIQKVLDTLF